MTVFSERYTLGPLIGKGGVSEVYEATDRLLDRKVALKILSGNPGPREIERFEREAHLNARLMHPNIVPVYDTGRGDDGEPFIAMKRIRGRSVGELIESGSLTLRERLVVFIKLCDAVSYAHGEEVVHRDLKPDNVMVGAHGEVLLVDWGLARGPDGRGPERAAGAGTQLTRVGQILGTPYYMAPEQAQGQGRTAGPAADVFALGALLYTLISGHPPYDSVDLYDVVMRVATGEVRPLREVAPKTPASLVQIVERAMALEPADRFASVADLQRAVRKTLQAKPPSGNRTLWIGAMAVAVVGLGLAVGVALFTLIVLLT